MVQEGGDIEGEEPSGEKAEAGVGDGLYVQGG